MQRELDTVQFESRDEIREIALALQEYIRRHPADATAARRLYDLLDVMDMEW